MAKKPITPDKLKKADKDKFDKVKKHVKSMEQDDATNLYRVVARTTYRDKTGAPDVELINADLGAALDDLYTIEHAHDNRGVANGEPA